MIGWLYISATRSSLVIFCLFYLWRHIISAMQAWAHNIGIASAKFLFINFNILLLISRFRAQMRSILLLSAAVLTYTLPFSGACLLSYTSRYRPFELTSNMKLYHDYDQEQLLQTAALGYGRGQAGTGSLIGLSPLLQRVVEGGEINKICHLDHYRKLQDVSARLGSAKQDAELQNDNGCCIHPASDRPSGYLSGAHVATQMEMGRSWLQKRRLRHTQAKSNNLRKGSLAWCFLLKFTACVSLLYVQTSALCCTSKPAHCAAADDNPDYAGSCGRCYAVRQPRGPMHVHVWNCRLSLSERIHRCMKQTHLQETFSNQCQTCYQC